MSVATGRLWLETRRLTLRPLRDDDLDELCLLLGDAGALVHVEPGRREPFPGWGE